MVEKVIIGTRGSNLALWQAYHIQDKIRKIAPECTVEVKVIVTKGDKIQNIPLPEIGGKGLFTEEIENELLADEIQIAVHSLKDLPSELPTGLIYAGSPKRGNPRDAFISHKWKSLEEVPRDGCIATGSLRRQALTQQICPQAQFCDLRGSIETRLAKLEKNNWDGIIMASAALERLEMQERITQHLDPQKFVPAVGQGAVGLEINEKREDIFALVEKINDEETCQQVKAERSFMKELGGGCSVPLGAIAQHVDGNLDLYGFVARSDGSSQIREKVSGSPKDGIELGIKLAEIFLSKGAREVLESN